MGKRSRGASWCAGLAFVLALFAPSAQANTVVVGSQLSTPGFTLVAFIPPATVTNSVLPGPMTAASPTDGTVISWSVIGSGPLTPRVIRPTASGTYTGAGTGSPKSAISGGVSGPFQTSLPIKAGDLVGVSGQSGSTIGTAPNPGATSLYFEPPPVDGGPGVAPTGTNPGAEEAVSATVRFCLVPKLKGKSPQQARDALHAADCKVGPKSKGKKRTKRKKVIKQTIKAGKSVSDTTAVGFTVSRKRS